MSDTPRTPAITVCADPACDKPSRARGLCVACYYRRLRAGDITAGTQTQRFRHRLANLDREARTAVCAECGPTTVLPRDGGKRFRCGTEANARSRDYKRAYRASRGLDSQCAICGGTKRLSWDHDHGTGDYRGTLCGPCNSALGLMHDDPERLRAAADYLEARAA